MRVFGRLKYSYQADMGTEKHGVLAYFDFLEFTIE